MNILVCDDDREIVEAIEIYLSQEGYHILKAYDGMQALKVMEQEEVHLLIIDVMMPVSYTHLVQIKKSRKQNYGFVARWGWIPGRKAAGDLRRLWPARQTGLRVEVILRLPEATLQGYRGKSGGRLDAFHPPFPSPAVLEAQRTPPGE